MSIETFKGVVDVRTWDEPRAEISARIEPDTSCGTEAQQMERVRLTKVDIDSTPARLSIRSNYDRLKDLDLIPLQIEGMDMACNAHPYVSYSLRIPRTARLEITDHKSKIAVDGLKADARIATHKGSVHVRGHDGGLELTTHRVTSTSSSRGSPSRADSRRQGDIEVAVPRAAVTTSTQGRAGGSLDAPFALDAAAVGRRRSTSRRSTAAARSLEMSTRNGTLKITEK